MKKFLMLRGRTSGHLIVVSRWWYINKSIKPKVWEIVGQDDDKETLIKMGSMSDKWLENAQRNITEGI